MTATLLESVRQNEAAQRAAALDVYRTLTRRADAPADGDAEALRGAMATLGITEADVQADLHAMDAERQLTAAVVPPEELAAGLAAARASWAEVRAEQRAVMKAAIDGFRDDTLLQVFVQFWQFCGRNLASDERMREWYARSEQRWAVAVAVKRASDDAARGAADLRRKNPRVFGTDGAA